MNAVTKAMGKLYKSYLFTIVVKDLKKLSDVDFKKQARKAQKTLQNVEWNREALLHRVGLTPYRPARRTLGGSLLFLCGAAIGAFAGMAIAPMKGEELRKNLKGKMPMFKQGALGTQAPAQA